MHHLLVAVVGRDQRAFRSLMRLASGRVYGVLCRMLQDRRQAEDAMQEVFIRVWTKAHLYDPERAEPLAWITALARNHAIDLLRRASRERTESTDEVDAFVADTVSVEQRMEQEGRARLVIHCLKQLPEARATAIRLAYLGGWTYEQIADHLAMPLNTVRTWLRRALVSLRDCAGNG